CQINSITDDGTFHAVGLAVGKKLSTFYSIIFFNNNINSTQGLIH
ncbi:uncharacterized protein METZ01_LOCUS277661, partial [marine metagenome]